MESGCVLGDQFKADWSWRPRQTQNHVGPASDFCWMSLLVVIASTSSSKSLMTLSNVPKQDNVIR